MSCTLSQSFVRPYLAHGRSHSIILQRSNKSILASAWFVSNVHAWLVTYKKGEASLQIYLRPSNICPTIDVIDTCTIHFCRLLSFLAEDHAGGKISNAMEAEAMNVRKLHASEILSFQEAKFLYSWRSFKTPWSTKSFMNSIFIHPTIEGWKCELLNKFWKVLRATLKTIRSGAFETPRNYINFRWLKMGRRDVLEWRILLPHFPKPTGPISRKVLK